MAGKVWDYESPEFLFIEKVFDERFPEYNGAFLSDELDLEAEAAFQGFLAAWEFTRGITISTFSNELKELNNESNT